MSDYILASELPQISFERNMNHNYMILASRDYFGEVVESNADYRKKMVLENEIPSLLPVKHRLVNGEMRYYYMVNSLESLAGYFAKREITFMELKTILKGCAKLFESLEEYLLDGSQIILKPEYIYIDTQTFETYFTCFPEYESDIRKSFMEFVDMLLTKIDHNDNDAVILGYRVYRYSKNPNFCISEIEHIVESHVANDSCAAPSQEQPYVYQTEKTVLIDTSLYDTPMYEQIIDRKEESAPKKQKDIRTIGIAICMSVAILALAIVLADRNLDIIGLGAKGEMYMFGIVAVSLAETAILAISRSKQKKEREEALTA